MPKNAGSLCPAYTQVRTQYINISAVALLSDYKVLAKLFESRWGRSLESGRKPLSTHGWKKSFQFYTALTLVVSACANVRMATKQLGNQPSYLGCHSFHVDIVSFLSFFRILPSRPRSRIPSVSLLFSRDRDMDPWPISLAHGCHPALRGYVRYLGHGIHRQCSSMPYSAERDMAPTRNFASGQ